MGVHITLIFIPEGTDSPVPEDGIGGNEWQDPWLVAPEYDGMGPFWFAPDDPNGKFANMPPVAMALPLPDGRWYYAEPSGSWATQDLIDSKWMERIAQTRKAFKKGHREQRLYTKS